MAQVHCLRMQNYHFGLRWPVGLDWRPTSKIGGAFNHVEMIGFTGEQPKAKATGAHGSGSRKVFEPGYFRAEFNDPEVVCSNSRTGLVSTNCRAGSSAENQPSIGSLLNAVGIVVVAAAVRLIPQFPTIRINPNDPGVRA